MTLKTFLLKRAVSMVIVLIVLASINFFLFQVLPFTVLGIDPKEWFVPIIGAQHNLQYIEKIREKVISSLGLNLPLQIRFFVYLKAMFTFDFGYNVGGTLSGPVSETIIRYTPYTALLLGLSTIASYIIGIYAGAFSAARRGKWQDNSLFVSSLFFYAMPSFWIGTILVLLFAYYLRWTPPNAVIYFTSYRGWAYVLALLKAMALPFFSLTLISFGGIYLVMRNTSIDVITEDYILMAKAKGLSSRQITYRHVLRNALLPQITSFALSMGFMLSGAVITETVFGWPGLGYWTFVGIVTLDFPLEQAIFFVIGVMVVVANFAADVLYGFFDPRIRAG